jgi:pimeloyl-ACP methyl ester carboxylesterase
MARNLASLLFRLLLVVLSLFAAQIATSMPVSAQAGPRLTMLNQAGEAVTRLTDGALVRFSVEVAEAVPEATTFALYLDSRSARIADCRIPAGATNCFTNPTGTLGWYWENATVRPTRTVHIAAGTRLRWQPVASLEIGVKPRPVVLVHGFGSDYSTWLSYLGPSGFLAHAGLAGYAVGDRQVEGTMHAGSLFNPRLRTNTIADNAAALAQYITNVKALTGAEQVDLVVHSMGGLISRYYIDRLMQDRDVAQLIMLGTPHGGSNCAVMVATLGLLQPAGLELREDYVRNVFNPQITERRDIPFYNFAGTPIQRRLLSPCSAIPNDLVVSLESATAVAVELVEVPYLHTDMSLSEPLFIEHVLPLLQQSREDFEQRGAQATTRVTADDEPIQFSQVYTGFVTTPEGITHVINIDNDVAVAAFGLYDPSRTLTVTVRGATGAVITLTPDIHGLTIIDDPEALLYLGYGFENPNPGAWQVTVRTTPATPPLGASYAIMAQYVGGASIRANLSNHLPALEEVVELSASMRVGDETLDLESAEVLLTDPSGFTRLLSITVDGAQIAASFQPDQEGVYGVDVKARALLPDGTIAERATFLALEAFITAPERRQ